MAIDNTLGSFSPFQGRVYLVYTKPPNRPVGGANPDPPEKTSIFLLTSDSPSGSPFDRWTPTPALATTIRLPE